MTTPLLQSHRWKLAFLAHILIANGGAAKESPVVAGPKPGQCWRVEDVRRGMKGYGLTVMTGTKVETFQAKVIGVLHSTSPGRDMILCRLSGLGLERTGIIAGMSGSPVYIQNKLLGAVAYGWSHGKDPIAGITPFCQMHSFVEAFEKRDLARKKKSKDIGKRHRLSTPIDVGRNEYRTVRVSSGTGIPKATKDEMWMTPLRAPLAATGFSAASLGLLKKEIAPMGLIPMQGGSAGPGIEESEKNAQLEPGGPLSVTLVRGDFDLSGIGTVTHIEGDRVYGWGHPFMSLGGCDLPLMLGYVHTVYPRQTVSFKMGSPLRTIGVINADVSTCIAGWLGRKPDMMPMTMKVRCADTSRSQTFSVDIARHSSLMASLVYTCLVNSVDMEGQLPEEMTAVMHARIELKDHKPIIIRDTFSGFSGARAAQALYSQIASMVSRLKRNDFKGIRITKISCDTKIYEGRSSAEIEQVVLDESKVKPGGKLTATVHIRPYRSEIEKIRVTVPVPADLPDGTYHATFTDDVNATRSSLRDNPTLYYPRNREKLIAGMQIQAQAKRTQLAVRIPVGASGVSVGGKDLQNLPGSMVQILSTSKEHSVRKLSKSIIHRAPTEWVIEGRRTVSFQVSRKSRINLR